jgi:GT2 family glycosyltransferase
MAKVTIIIPVIRPEGLERCVNAIKENAGIPESEYQILHEVDAGGIGAPLMVKKLTDRAPDDLVMFLGDDTIPQPGFLREALAAMEALPDGWGLVGLNDLYHSSSGPATHWLASKKLLPLVGGEFFHTGYYHWFCDNELTDRARSLGRFVWAGNAVIKHDNDEIKRGGHVRDDQKDAFEHDKRLYMERRKLYRGTLIAICMPLIDRKVDSDFFLSFLELDLPDGAKSKIYTPHFPTGFPTQIASVRNNLVYQALSDNCSHVLMMDTDQVHPPDTITRLHAIDADIASGVVHRRYPPFDPIFFRGSRGNYKHVPDDDVYSGDIIEVDLTGCGCIMYKAEVFESLPAPWFVTAEDESGKVIGEDIYFCEKAREAGYRIFVDTGLWIDHISTFRVTRATYELFKRFNNFQFEE